MRITVLTTQSKLNQTICKFVAEGLSVAGIETRMCRARIFNKPTPSLSYGFLRGVADCYHECERANVDWWNVDRGFFKANHLNGYYRLGYRHLQPLFDPARQFDDSRWKALEISLQPWRLLEQGHILICPPTPALGMFYNLNISKWIEDTIEALPVHLRDQVIVRTKADPVPLDAVLAVTRLVITHSSNVALEAIVKGIPAIATTGIVQSWNKLTVADAATLTLDALTRFDRQALVNQAAWAQWTLNEFRRGLPWRARVSNN